MAFFGGNTSLGATSTPAKPGGLFSSFGTGGATAATAFGSNAATSAAPTFGTSAFGTTGFGTAATSSAPSLFGGTATATNTTGGFGGFGATTNTAPSFGGFGTAATTSAGGFGGFGATSTTSTAPAFGGFGTQTNTFGGFGTGGSTFGSTFNKPATATVTPGFGGFGGTTSFMLGQPQQQIPQLTPDEAFAQSIFNVSIYGDERDTLIAKWNYLQAMWGTGKSFYSQNAVPVEITPQNYLCRFKAMGYSRLPGKDNKMGLVALNFNKPLADVKAVQQQIINSLNSIFGNKPNLAINIEASKEHEEKKCQLVIYVEERSQITPNETKRILATEVSNYLNQANIKAQLGNIGIVEVLALVLPDEDQLKEYLENPPKGIDPRMWRQAKLDNPDPTKFIPVPMIGFNDLKWRTKCQEHETETHALYLKKVERDLAELRQRHVAATAKIMEHKRKLAELSHNILKIIVKQECTRKVGLALTPEEEALRTKLENMQALVSAPTQFKAFAKLWFILGLFVNASWHAVFITFLNILFGMQSQFAHHDGRLSELLSQMRMQRNQYAFSGGSEYAIDKDSEEEMKSFLAMQQKAMEVLTDTVTKDLKALQVIIEGMPELVRV